MPLSSLAPMYIIDGIETSIYNGLAKTRCLS